MVGALDVEGVDRDAALGADAREGDVEGVVGDDFRQPVEEADLVARLDLDDRALHREFVIDLDGGRKRAVEHFAARRCEVAGGGDLLGLGDDVREQVAVGDEGFLDGAGEFFLGGRALDDAAAGFDDVKGVDGDVVGAGDHLRAEDAEAGHAEGAGEFVEEAGAVPGDDVDDGEGAVEVVLPFDHGFERADGVGGGDRLEEAVHHLDVQGDLRGVRVDEVTVGEETEVRIDLVGTDAGDGFRDEFLLGHFFLFLMAGVERRAKFKPLKGGAVKGRVQRVLVTIPEVGGGAAGVAKGVDVEVPQALGVAHEFGEGSRGLGVIYIPLLPEACHRQMILDGERHEFLALGGDAEALEERSGEPHAALGVALDGLGLADVVEQEGEVEEGRVGALVQGGAIFEGDGLGLGEDAVELADGVQGVNVGGVAVVILVLHQAGEAVEFGDVAAEHAEFVHLGEGGVNGADFGEDGAEADAGVGRARDLGGQAREGGADELREVEIQRGIELLAVAEHPQEAHRVVDEGVGGFGGEFAAAEDEAVEALGAGEARGAQAFAEGIAALAVGAAAADAEGEAVLDEFRDAENGLRGAVVVLHEMLHPGEHFDFGVAEVLRDAGLQIQAHDIRGAGAHEVEVVAHAQEKVVAAAEGREVVGAQVVLHGEFVDAGDAELHPGHPDGVLVVAQAADAVLDVGLLVENGVGVFRAAARLVVEAHGDVALRVLAHVVAAVSLGKRVVELGRAGDEPRLEQGGLGLDLAPRLVERLVDGAGGVADFQAAVPENVEDFVGEVFLQGLRGGGLRLGGEEKHHVDVAQGAEFAATVAAEGDEGDGGGQGADKAGVGLAGVVEQPDEHGIDEGRAVVGGGEPGGALLVPQAERGRFGLEELLAGGQPLGNGHVAGEAEPVGGGGREDGGHRESAQ